MLDPRQFAQYLGELEAAFGLPSGFLIALPEEPEWWFVVELHALLEAALTQALIAEFADSRVTPILEDLNVGGRLGKLSLARRLDLMPKSHADFIGRLSRIRSRIVHSLEGLSLTYAKYVASLDANERPNARSELVFLGTDDKAKTQEFLEENPRRSMWAHGLAIVSTLMTRKLEADGAARIRQLNAAVGERLLSTEAPTIE